MPVVKSLASALCIGSGGSGFVTESLDGSPVAPLMGDYAGYDVGTLRVRAVPSFWIHVTASRTGTSASAIRPGWRTRPSPPGPYSPEREYNVIAFDARYLQRMERIA